MPRKEAHLRREPGSERRAERWRKVSGERPAQHPSRDGIRLPRIAARLRARLHPSRDELLRLADAALVGFHGSEQRQGDQLRVILPFVPPELGHSRAGPVAPIAREREVLDLADRKSTRLNSSHLVISYAVFCLKKKKKTPRCMAAART